MTDLELRILAFERQWWQHRGSKEDAIREQFGITVTRYYQLLNRVLDSQEAMLSDPVTVDRLRRLRDRPRRASSRSIAPHRAPSHRLA